MKKRLLALALCLVMMTSLLPITAAAEEFTVNSVHVVGDFCDWAFSGSYPMQALGSDVYGLTISNANRSFDNSTLKFAINNDWTHFFGGTFGGSGVESDAIFDCTELIMLNYPYRLADITFRLDLHNFDGKTKKGAKFTITITDASHNFDTGWTSDETHHWHKCLNEGCTEVKDKALHVDNNNDHFCDDCGASVHTWQFKAAGNTLTGTCLYCGKEVSVTLKADSVTLPKSPFNAWLEGWESFHTTFPNATAVFDYQYEGPGGGGFNPVAADPANAKAGTYQAGAKISNLPGLVEQDGVASRANQNGEAYLWVKYTAVDPAVTAQTGDNRPIELMLGSLVVFSALAAAAFIVDSKRRSQP